MGPQLDSLRRLLNFCNMFLTPPILFRWVHNPRTEEMAGAITTQLGELKSVNSVFAFPGLPPPDIRQTST